MKLFLTVFLLASGCCAALFAQNRAGTAEGRAALFEYILAKTLEREAFSPVKNNRLGLEVEKALRSHRDELIAADTDAKLYYALVKISNARKDRHLKVSLVKGGLEPAGGGEGEPSNYPLTDASHLHAPIRFAVDYGAPGRYFFFVSDAAKNLADFAGKNLPEVGDKLIAINDQPIAEYFKAIEPYHRYSTANNLWWQVASWMPQKSAEFPPAFYRANFAATLERRDGQRYSVTLPYLQPDVINWKGTNERRYSGFRLLFSTQTYDFYVHDAGKPVVLLAWHGFRENLVADVDRLLDYAQKNGLLDHALIWDGTRSRGGSKGAYALQRFSPKPFKVTFGNLRLSDVTKPFIEEKRQQFARRKLVDSGVAETIDDGSWLMAWLEDDVTQALAAGKDYSNNVPFKLAHLPKDSDGILPPAAVHFRGKLVCLLGPYGGSHLDQFAAMVIDNKLGHVIGMPAGGYSNTWEWEETLVFPMSKKPVAKFMWSIGHTLRPNGEILEGNPAEVDELVPVTRENYLVYYPTLLSRALRHLGLE